MIRISITVAVLIMITACGNNTAIKQAGAATANTENFDYKPLLEKMHQTECACLAGETLNDSDYYAYQSHIVKVIRNKADVKTYDEYLENLRLVSAMRYNMNNEQITQLEKDELEWMKHKCN